ncbi:MAG: hypothetical protein JRH20_22930 [Deltaproteobacteria bacterium]|nr:hypothetical protein [Deltaproteobacteria bacterium]
MKTWDQPPTKAEVEAELKSFFALLQEGKLEAAGAAVAHHSDDWESQVWSLWQDTYLIYLEELDEEVPDDSFEGKGWLKDLRWLRDLRIDETFRWDEEGDCVDPEGEHVAFNLVYRREVLDLSGTFEVIKKDDGYHLTRESIRIM